MKFFRRDLINQNGQKINIDEAIEYDLSQFEDYTSSLRQLKNVHVHGSLEYLSPHDQVVTDLKATGEMVVGCAISNEDVTIDFVSEINEVFSFIKTDSDEFIEVKTDFIDLAPVIFQSILFEVPIKTIKPGLIDYPKGEGWEVLTEKEFQNQEKPIDPRLAKLKEFNVK